MIKIPYKNILMVQAVLTPESKSLLLSEFPAMHENEFAHHVTIAFKPSIEQARELSQDCGEEVEFYTVGEASDEKCQAVLVEGIISNNKMPHITISCAEGTAPVYSNKLLSETESYNLVRSKIPLTAIITFVAKNGDRYQEPIEIV